MSTVSVEWAPPPHLAKFCGGKQPSELSCDELQVGQRVQICNLRVTAEVQEIIPKRYLCEVLITDSRSDVGKSAVVRVPVALLRQYRAAENGASSGGSDEEVVGAATRSSFANESSPLEEGGDGDVFGVSHRGKTQSQEQTNSKSHDQEQPIKASTSTSGAATLLTTSPVIAKACSTPRAADANDTENKKRSAASEQPAQIQHHEEEINLQQNNGQQQQVRSNDIVATSPNKDKEAPSGSALSSSSPVPPESPASIFSDSSLRRKGKRKKRKNGTNMDTVEEDLSPVRQSTSFSRSLYGSSKKTKKPTDLNDFLKQTERDFVWNQLPRTPYLAHSGVKECVLCLVDFEPSDTVVRLPCLHTFHEECAADWVRTHGTCPTCSLDVCANLMPPDEQY
ncbi:unnamed protein product [Amoebophrya sp. A120]|nr:unnamed protein product [Amoebophrya sp. A120]|eukprot:GSA120T00024094001.1